MDDADPGLESGSQSICYIVRGQGASMNLSYTFNLTPPIFLEKMMPALKALKNVPTFKVKNSAPDQAVLFLNLYFQMKPLAPKTLLREKGAVLALAFSYIHIFISSLDESCDFFS